MTAPFDLLLRNALLPDGRRVDLGCRGGLIAAVAAAGALGAAHARATRELGGRLVTPGLVDAHVHLDKAFRGLAEGRPADLVVWEAAALDEAVGGVAPRRLVVKAGRASVEHRHAVDEPWRAPTRTGGV